jgi:hypothetical protein
MFHIPAILTIEKAGLSYVTHADDLDAALDHLLSFSVLPGYSGLVNATSGRGLSALAWHVRPL